MEDSERAYRRGYLAGFGAALKALAFLMWHDKRTRTPIQAWGIAWDFWEPGGRLHNWAILPGEDDDTQSPRMLDLPPSLIGDSDPYLSDIPAERERERAFRAFVALQAERKDD